MDAGLMYEGPGRVNTCKSVVYDRRAILGCACIMLPCTVATLASGDWIPVAFSLAEFCSRTRTVSWRVSNDFNML